tara:strand:+ start:1202 stop:1381 length:180 start_codon:yes stop_codon:yes gene_type:complete
MAEKIDNRLKDEVKSYNALNSKKSQMEKELGAINQEMLKILGKIELLQDLNSLQEKEKK